MTAKKPRESETKFPKLPFQFLQGIRSTTNVHGRWYCASDIAGKMKTQTGAVTRKVKAEDVRMMYRETDRGYRDLAFISQDALFEVALTGRDEWSKAARGEIVAAALVAATSVPEEPDPRDSKFNQTMSGLFPEFGEYLERTSREAGYLPRKENLARQG